MSCISIELDLIVLLELVIMKNYSFYFLHFRISAIQVIGLFNKDEQEETYGSARTQTNWRTHECGDKNYEC